MPLIAASLVAAGLLATGTIAEAEIAPISFSVPQAIFSNALRLNSTDSSSEVITVAIFHFDKVSGAKIFHFDDREQA
ncbi:hypothetical protein [Catenuloplanes japonicus]|uniref:hypothetical protein n=1 Tax=Catenuloplanes japonicus TaxID=33876 RepID=UPI0005261A48|nr:hypothetical protein [Catenuloplanes japonicus]